MIRWNSNRKFGIELEFNYPDSYKLSEIIKKIRNEKTKVSNWCHNVNNKLWYCKPDRSCGYEIASRVMNGYNDIKILHKLIVLLKNNDVEYSENCGFHVHVNINDFSEEEYISLLSYWIKSEHLFVSMLPNHRRNNKYCYLINRIPILKNMKDHNNYNIYKIESKLFFIRGAFNIENVSKRKSSRIEIRLGNMSLDENFITNWVMLLIWFVETCKIKEKPNNLKWFSLNEFLNFMKLSNNKLSKSIENMKNELLKKIIENKNINYKKIVNEASKLMKVGN